MMPGIIHTRYWRASMNLELKHSLMAPAILATLLGATPALASPILPSELASFAVLSATPDATNTGLTTLNGNLGVSPALSTPGSGAIVFPLAGTGVIVGPLSTAGVAQSQLSIAISTLGLMTPATPLVNPDLTGTINPGVYSVGAAATNLSGHLILDGLGDPNASWVFLMSSTLITSANAMVTLINAGAGASVFWEVASSATLGTGTVFEGNILAHTSITLAHGASIGCGRALANTGEVTMDTNTIGMDCSGILTGSDGLDGDSTALPPVVTVSEPGSWAMMMAGLGALGLVRKHGARSASRVDRLGISFRKRG